MTKKEKNITINFEQELEKLEDIINKMESGQLNLEDTLQKYEEGIKLVTNCQKQLKNAEQKVKILTMFYRVTCLFCISAYHLSITSSKTILFKPDNTGKSLGLLRTLI